MDKRNRKVPIKNILYMFSYVWDKAESEDFTYLNNKDDFDSPNILSELFLTNVDYVIKRGLYREYNEKTEEIKSIKGKIDFKNSLNNMSFQNAKAICTFDELEENNQINKVIKSTAYKLFKCNGMFEENVKKLNNVLLFFNNVDIIEINDKSFEINFNRNNLYTYYLILICRLINDLTMLSEEEGKYKFKDIFDSDDIMAKIYEMFIYKFYEYHLYKQRRLYKVSYQKELQWLVGENNNKSLLPKMNLDILLEGINNNQMIIIDTKYYDNILVSNQGWSEKLKTGNLYQMYTYMNQINTKNNLRGILLYPYNGNMINEEYDINLINRNDKGKLEIRTIDLSQDWKKIENDLLELIIN